MECNKVLSETTQFRSKIEKALISDVSTLIDTICDKYDIYRRGHGAIVERNELRRNLLEYFAQNLHVNSRCGAITKAGTRCTNKPHGNLIYCGKHAYLQHTQNNVKKQDTAKNGTLDLGFSIQFESHIADNNPLVPNTLKKKLVNDSFYLYDSKYIYDNTTHEKVGYINSDNTFIFTDDPFELETV
jgi:hypothetical protein